MDPDFEAFFASFFEIFLHRIIKHYFTGSETPSIDIPKYVIFCFNISSMIYRIKISGRFTA